MNPRERVLAAINHEQPDRVPICIGVSNATGMKMKPYRELKQLLGIDAPDQYIYDWPELGTARLDEQTMRRLHSDVRGVLDLEPADVLAAITSARPTPPGSTRGAAARSSSPTTSGFPASTHARGDHASRMTNYPLAGHERPLTRGARA